MGKHTKEQAVAQTNKGYNKSLKAKFSYRGLLKENGKLFFSQGEKRQANEP